MKRLYSNKLGATIVGLCLTVIGITAVAGTLSTHNVQEYALTVGGERLWFVARPELGYVVKARQDAASIEALCAILKHAGAVDIRPVGGLGRKGVSVVHSERPADENRNTVRLLRLRSDVQYAAPLFSSNGETVAIIPEIVVRVTPDTEIEQVDAICETAGCTINKRMEFTEQEYLLEVFGPDAEAVFAAVEQLGKAPEVEWACPNTAFRPKLCGQVIPNDEYFPMQWHLYNTGQSGGTPGADIRGPEAWEIATGDPNIIVAVIDSGVDSNHPDLFDNLVPGYDFYENDDKPDPALDHPINSHGTALAGLIAAQSNNGIGVAGVTWKCKIMPIRIFRVWADGKQDFLTQAEIATALRWGANNGADILSNSWLLSKNPTPICHSAILDVTKAGSIGRDGKGCVVLFAAGNDSGAIVWYPPKYPEVITVGATDHNDVRCYYSSYGPELDIVAPSSRGRTDQDWVDNQGMGWIWTTDIVGVPGRSSTHNSDPSILDYIGSASGTSSACPIAAGVAALILSVNPDLTNLEVAKILYQSARDLGEPGWDPYYGWGHVDARAAVEMALNWPLVYVDDDGPADFDTIQAGIDAANDGDTVLVAPGEYIITESITFRGKAITVRSEAGPEVTTMRMSESTSNLDRASVIIFENGETETTVLEGFTVSGGRGCWWEYPEVPGTFYQVGGGIFCIDSSPTIIGCIVSDNHTILRNKAQDIGGGVFLANSSAVVNHCRIHNNSTAFWAGGMAITDGSPMVTDCIISNNTAYHQDSQSGGLNIFGSPCKPVLMRCKISANSARHAAGGIQVSSGSQPTFIDCVISDNQSGAIGGILSSYSSVTTLKNCIITRNSAELSNGGLGCGHNAEAVLTNCTITGNTAGSDSGGVLSYDNSVITVQNCIIFGNMAPIGPEIGFGIIYKASMNISYSNIGGGLSSAYINQGCTLNWGQGNIAADPLFADPANGDYHLKSQAGRWNPVSGSWAIDGITSPCIDTGDPSSPVMDELQPNGNRINMGAYGGTGEASKSP